MVPLYIVYSCQWASLVSQMVKNLLALQETQFPSLGWEYPPGEGNGYPLQSSCLDNLWTEESGELQSMGLKESDTTERLSLHFFVLANAWH